MKIFTPLLLLLISIPAYAAEDLKLTLPPTIYAVPGVTLGIYHDNMVLSENSSAYNFEYKCKIGNIEPRRWVIKPTDEDVGSHPIEVLVKDASGRILEKQKVICESPPEILKAPRHFASSSLGIALHIPRCIRTNWPGFYRCLEIQSRSF